MATRPNFWRLMSISLTVTLSVQVIRALFPLLIYQPGLRLGLTTDANVAIHLLLVFSVAIFAPLIARFLGAGRAFGVFAAGLAILRLGMQIVPSANIPLATLAAAVAVIALPLGILWTYTAENSGRNFGLGLLLGLALDAALNTASLTWDYLWRRDLTALLAALVISGLLLVALWQSRSEWNIPAQDNPIRLMPLMTTGLFLLLQMLFLQNPAFVAAFTLFPLAAACAVVLAADALALVLAPQWLHLPRAAKLAAGIALITALSQIHGASGLAAAVVIVAGQILTSGFLVTFSHQSGGEKQPPLLVTCLIAGIGSALFAIFVGVYYAPNGFPLPYSSTVAAVIVGGLLALAGIITPVDRPAQPMPWRAAVVPLAALVILLGLVLTQPPLPSQTPLPFRLMTYNIHQGLDLNGWVGLEAIAQAIEAQNPDVVALQEVSRGLFPNGSVEMAEWLSQRLHMPYRFAPASDEQFGDAILSRLPIVASDIGLLPRSRAPQNRGYVRVRLDVGGGETVMVICTHLNHFGTDIRIPQAQALVELWGNSPRTIITGDMNTHPGTPDIAVFQQAGLLSAQDVTGNDGLMTFDSENPYARIDWIFGSPNIAFSDFAVPRTTASDHLPVAVTIALPNR